MASIGDVAAILRAAVATAEEAAGQVRAADERVETALGPLQVALSDSTNHNAHDGLGSLSAVRERLAETLAALKAGTDRMSEYIASIAGGGAVLPAPGGRAGGSGTPPAGRVFNPRKFDASKLAGLRRYSEAGTAEGRLYGADGSPHSDRVLRARPPESSPFPPASVRERYRDATPNRGHIEGEVAATMRRERLRETTLYLNAEPCDNRGRGCKENTHAFLPEGSVLNIWAVNDDGSRVFKRVNGTGEAIDGTTGHAGPGADGGAGGQVHGGGDA